MSENNIKKSWWTDYGQLLTVIAVIISAVTFVKLLMNDQNHRMDRIEDRLLKTESYQHDLDKRLAIKEIQK